MHDFLLVRHFADAAPLHKGCHQYFRNHRDPLRGQLLVTPKKLTVRVVNSNPYREEGMEDVSSSIPVNPEKGRYHQSRYRVHLSGEAPQEVVDPPSLPLIRGEGGPIGVRHS